MPFRVKRLEAREILDSRGNPTVEVDLTLAGGRGGATGRAAVPSGASTGAYEAAERRDGNPRRYLGKGTLGAVRAVEGAIARAVRGRPFAGQKAFDDALVALDGTPQKQRLGANAILGCSMAFACARASQARRPLYQALGGPGANVLPVPLMNVINGGAHADNGLAFQEFMIVPLGFPRFREALRAGAEVYQRLKGLLRARGLSTAVGDEGGFAPRLPSLKSALDLLLSAIRAAGYRAGREVALALDVAATEFFRNGRYHAGDAKRDAAGMIRLLSSMARDYPIVSIEDGLAEDDWAGWRDLHATLGRNILLVGDDLYVTNTERLRRGIRERASNAILIKLNQIGTVSETLDAVETARAAGFAAVVSHRSGETEDAFIADLAVATGCGLIKTGAPCRSERTAKYNRLLRIEEELGARARFAGRGAFQRTA